MTWSQIWYPDSEDPRIHRAHTVEEAIIHVEGTGLSISQMTQKQDSQVSPREGLRERCRQV